MPYCTVLACSVLSSPVEWMNGDLTVGLRSRRHGESLPFIGCALFLWGSCLWEASTCHMLALNRTCQAPDLFIELKFKGWQFVRMRLGLEWRHLLDDFELGPQIELTILFRSGLFMRKHTPFLPIAFERCVCVYTCIVCMCACVSMCAMCVWCEYLSVCVSVCMYVYVYLCGVCNVWYICSLMWIDMVCVCVPWHTCGSQRIACKWDPGMELR